eukprot:CAMPEP_0202918302 /NCGR_PEP_ID=MMETSP1392-20130828/73137_1 /ASSEMBLY_ACC=CAM_ASM_000868 /TAXON_ID=225041 /ORGANISM="Chlamydomonas chlamydogama, Strain SAG 11-48b" /LENGTH=80 /DNA_ID=CAMNT_0049611319 /DNA_START=179 /DNA_END=418 /DNA_ORIENTATION=+
MAALLLALVTLLIVGVAYFYNSRTKGRRWLTRLAKRQAQLNANVAAASSTSTQVPGGKQPSGQPKPSSHQPGIKANASKE